MAQALTLKTNTVPSMFNKEMLLGGLFAACIPATWIGTLVIGGAGGVIGGYFGKQRIEKENKEGRQVKTPSLWNKETFIGMLLGLHIGALGAEIAAVAALGTAVTGVLAGPALALGAVAVVGGLVVAPIAGAYIGAKRGKQNMQREYDMAIDQLKEQVKSESRAPAIEQGVTDLTPAKSYTQQIDKERELAALQPLTR